MYKEEIDRCNTLDQLFKVWEKAQIDECDESLKKHILIMMLVENISFLKMVFLAMRIRLRFYLFAGSHIFMIRKKVKMRRMVNSFG